MGLLKTRLSWIKRELVILSPQEIVSDVSQKNIK